MLRRHLSIQHVKIPGPQSLDQTSQSHFRSIGFLREHRFPEETPSQRNPIDSSRQLSIKPTLHGMRETFFVKADIGLLHLRRDPGSVLSWARHQGTGANHGLEGLIKRDLKN